MAPKLPTTVQKKQLGALSTMRRRIERAIKTDRALPDRERAQMKVRVHPFIVGYDRWDWPPAAQTRFTPNRHDLDDYLPAMALLAKLPEDLRQIVMWAALGDSFASVAWRFARKYPETPNADECRARFWIAIARCVEIDHDARRRAAETAGEGRGAA